MTPESKGGSEAMVRIAKADLIPTTANLGEKYGSFAELRCACAIFRQRVNTWTHRETGKTSVSALDIEKTRLHPLPASPHTHTFGESRQVLRDQTVRFGSVRYSTPPDLVGQEARVRADGLELAVVINLSRLAHRPEWMQGPAGLTECTRHPLPLPGRPVIDSAHYPGHPQEMEGSPRQPKPKVSQQGGESLARTRPRGEVPRYAPPVMLALPAYRGGSRWHDQNPGEDGRCRHCAA
ncbi:hypothetical protein ACFW9I_36545 [[Kitasatospora] papulosa]|uniref:Mu transposase domain-containing protein n=1 Tax=[Kitasatospora] papulosa TaxID=1464011 RepID=UPI00367FC573